MEDDAKMLDKHGYTLDRTLGEGSYCKVRSAYSKKLKRKVAIKIISKTKVRAEFPEKFLPCELEVLSSLKYPYIVMTFKIFCVSEKKQTNKTVHSDGTGRRETCLSSLKSEANSPRPL